MDKKLFEELKRKEQEIMEQYGYVIHYVFPEEGSDEVLLDCHTHGLKENFNHIDLQIVLPIPTEVIGGIIHQMTESIKEGESFENLVMSERVIRDYPVQLVKIDTGDREVLRIVLPDVNGKFPGDIGCQDVYKNQLDDLNSVNN